MCHFLFTTACRISLVFGLSFISLMNTYACTHHPERLVHGQVLFTYTLKSTVRIVSVLSVICRQIVVFPFCYVLSSCPLDALAIWLIYIIVCYESCTYEPGLVLFVFARLALYVPSCRTCLIVNVLAFYTNADLIARLLRERLCCVLFIILFLFLSYIIIYTHTIRTRDNNSTSVHVRFLFYRRIGKYC